MPPKHLYRYQAFRDYSKSIFCNHSLKISNPTKFNDPFDGLFNICFSGEANQGFLFDLALKEAKATNPTLNNKAVEKIAREFILPKIKHNESYYEHSAMSVMRSRLGETIGVICLSEENNDTTMWGHYAQCHRGFCLRFNTEIDCDFKHAEQVTYHETLFSMNFCDLNQASKDGTGHFDWLYYKSKHWAYEKEWRVSYHDLSSEYWAFPPEALDGVILGCQISPENEANIRQWVQDYKAPIELMRAVQSRSKYELQIIGVDEEYIPKAPDFTFLDARVEFQTNSKPKGNYDA
jgi:hypothetical protein